MSENYENNQWERSGSDTGQTQNSMRAGDEFRQDNNRYTQAPQEGYYVPEEPNPGLSVAGMVCGILSLVLCCCSQYISLILALVGLGLSAYALAKGKPGRGMAIAGLVCSIIGLLISVLLVIGSLLMLTQNSEIQKILNEIRNESFS
ncbi:MAG: DUF4190 domain-containing protein [Lachnospiraceae bacterium]|nr:DUF4190 domain-containing protein [Lachnospiraceae bacterium]